MRSIKEICQILDIFKSQDASPKSELIYHNAYTLLIAIVLSAQSTDKGVNKATENLFKIADTPQKMLNLGIDKLKEHIKTIGLYNNKAKNIIELSQRLVKEYKGEVPQDREILESLPGVGRKTANVLLNVWWNQPTVAVDTHVLRLSKRLDLSDGSTPLSVETDLNKLPDEYKLHLNHWLVLFGRYICKAQKPNCSQCPVAKFCYSSDKKI
ncbi:MAG: endonuclease III [Alphaproteobacteria bacterium]|nr:endonuclease III [Alphaproteobacteria bacterium]